MYIAEFTFTFPYQSLDNDQLQAETATVPVRQATGGQASLFVKAEEGTGLSSRMEMDSVVPGDPSKMDSKQKSSADIKRRFEELMKEAQEEGVELPIKKQCLDQEDEKLGPEALAYKKKVRGDLDRQVEAIKKNRAIYKQHCDRLESAEKEIKEMRRVKKGMKTQLDKQQEEIDQTRERLTVTPDESAKSVVDFVENDFDISKTGTYWAPRGPRDIGTAEPVLGKNLATPLELPW
ncbi:uncharacterized protein TRUGW13939_09893 [Talaromyces rugulosus]|uniref:Uncharacterized protein n=1 Tax=Talaromyces rugulosus TaxID=121627 RepID=A0A7H8RAE6_TALRU|nr:uncharacterized protein TRUGW13939_09893 [Talaromyces rugulosus]QKX62731.1 hypothetical protein TRUGW13939_09893 [Talaromyces rugulosus]